MKRTTTLPKFRKKYPPLKTVRRGARDVIIGDVSPAERRRLAKIFKGIAGVIPFDGDSLEFLGKD